jgi:hypothetical protein
MPRPRKRTEYAQSNLTPGETINKVRAAFRRLFKICGVIEYQRKRFPDDSDDKIIDRATAPPVHLIVDGLSRMTKHPPSMFRTTNNHPTGGSKRGRPPAVEADLIAAECARHFEAITGMRAKLRTDSVGAYGPFFDLVSEIFGTTIQLTVPGPPTKKRAAARASYRLVHFYHKTSIDYG